MEIQEKKSAAALSRQAALLARSNADLEQFAYSASHHLQDPLRMITTYSQLLIRSYRGQLSGDAAMYLKYIGQGTTRMRELLADLLSYAQLTADERESPEVIDLNAALEKAKQNLQAAIEESASAVTSGPLPAVPGYEAHFIQLLQNLIANSIRYRSSDMPRIHVATEEWDGQWRIAVTDNGISIPPEHHRQIFGVFKRLHCKNIPGTGIGLAICQRVVERSGGRIRVESEPGRGATFYFTLPSDGFA